MSLSSDVELLAALARGDRTAFNFFFQQWYPRLRAFFIRGGHPDLADELAQEVLVRIWRGAATYDPNKAAPATWIFAIARNTRADVLRRPRFVVDPQDPAFVHEQPSPEGALDATRQAASLHEALAKLPEEQADVLREVFLGHQSYAEVAKAKDVPIGTVKSRARLAFASLRRWFGSPP